MKVIKKVELTTITDYKVKPEITFKKKRFRIMQDKKGAVTPTDPFEVGSMFEKNMIRLMTVPHSSLSGSELLQFKSRTVFYIEM